MAHAMAEGDEEMKKDIHKKQKEVTFKCLCGESFKAMSTSDQDEIHVEICSKCHPFYTGKQGTATLTGNVEKFRQKYGLKS